MQIAQEPIMPDERRDGGSSTVEFRYAADTEGGESVAVIGGADVPPGEHGAGREPVSALEPRTPGATRRWLARLRIRGDARGNTARAGSDAAGDVVLEMALLREENLRLKGECHRPADLGVLIGQLRLAAAYELEVEDPDEGWTLLAECHRVQEELRQAQLEVTTAITSLRARLAQLDGAHVALLNDDEGHYGARDAA